ncbi:YebC/PmpR family DNA-binding transcriptional regulator [Thermoflavifilum thermophilum]|uniref:Probable transcriptional regulatory protein SAMN05660895_1768 n=1 Tax=Thermoflavifilum thermophilum TaxID=1393122 RepID=A0A1I7NG32_9BACT|nr:YebC/PmpR family DNA-binding transcriptional regulator [Thermoflavifilum thermophilum]SFV33637.1 DNA-binding regulatory protein, YebC/PmpR family [Thermoflavifilum thermophilum]
MGRIFEVRKAKMFARWDRMAKQFTRLGKEIEIAVKQGGPDPENNPTLRRIIQNAKSVNMPKDRIEAAIKRAMDKDKSAYEEIIYEGYAPHGVAVLIETATDNPTRTVANLRMYFNRGGGSLATSGSVAFLFKRMGEFVLEKEKLHNPDELELELIDYGMEDFGEDEEGHLIVRTAFHDFGRMNEFLEQKAIPVVRAQPIYIPTSVVELPEHEAQQVLELVDKLEQDDDVQHVYHNLI